MHHSLLDRRFILPATCAAALLLGGCVLGPKYERPAASTPATWRWLNGGNTNAPALGTNWWTAFNDPDLDALVTRAQASNLSLRKSFARLQESRALLGAARSLNAPSLDFNGSAERDRRSPNRRLAKDDIVEDLPNDPLTRNRYSLMLETQYELDFWGRVRRSIESANAQLEAFDAAHQTARLTITSDVAFTYFSLRIQDAAIDVLQRSIALRRNFLAVHRSRSAGGVGADVEVSRAEAELANTEAELIEAQRQRTLFEHGLAVLCGEAPSEFRVEPRSLPLPEPPTPPPGLPSELLLRRPDVAEAERLAASRCAAIGVAKAEFLPIVRLTGSAGFESIDAKNLMSWESRTWGFGPNVTLPIFRGGLNRANLKAAEARYDEAIAEYRERVLIAFREVEDALVSAKTLTQKQETLKRAVAAARATNRYYQERLQGGLVNSLEVIDSQRTLLETERRALEALGNQYQTSIHLMKALGGGWHTPTPAKENVRPQSSPKP